MGTVRNSSGNMEIFYKNRIWIWLGYVFSFTHILTIIVVLGYQVLVQHLFWSTLASSLRIFGPHKAQTPLYAISVQ